MLCIRQSIFFLQMNISAIYEGMYTELSWGNSPGINAYFLSDFKKMN